MTGKSFKPIANAALLETPILKLLHTHEAIVLERIAMGAGATNWYYCRDKQHLECIEARLCPGSVVSFYFDDRILNISYNQAHQTKMERIIAETIDVMVGFLKDDGFTIDAEFIDNKQRLVEVTHDLTPQAKIFYGAFPDRDNDGVNAVTVILPDRDGVVRSHPH